MSKIYVLEFISLDGIIQAPGGPEEDTSDGFKFGGWTAPYFDEFAGEEMAAQMQPADLLLGRKTFDIFESYWPAHKDQWPGINDVNKYVVSHTRNESNWANSIFLKDIEEIKKLKEREGRVLQVYGSANLVQTLFKYDLVDELWLKIFPVTLGKGKRLFTEDAPPAAYTLIGSKTSPSGVIFADYRRAGAVQTGSVA